MNNLKMHDHKPYQPDRRDHVVPINRNELIGKDCYLLTVSCPDIAQRAKPGQFVMLRVAQNLTDPLLRRPISIMEISSSGDVSILYKVVGRGTRILADSPPGTVVSMFGPLGNGFTPPPHPHTAFLVGGGIGIPPLLFLAQSLVSRSDEPTLIACLGGRSHADVLIADRFKNLKTTVCITTEDGSVGETGRVTEPLIRWLTRTVAPSVIYACGPEPMLRAIDAICADFNVPGQLSFEEHMACGVGACLGCVVMTTDGVRRICTDGPVFPAGVVSRWRIQS